MLDERVVPVLGPDAFPVDPGDGLDGVVMLTPQNGGTCTGSLLYTGQHILTAAHCVDLNNNGSVDAGTVSVMFELPGPDISMQNIPSTEILIHHSYNGDVGDGYDLALITLPSLAPFGAERYDLYRDDDEVDEVFTLVGYGRTGVSSPTGPPGTKLQGRNRFDASSYVFSGPPNDTFLAYDFDASDEFPAKGDSGGPAFLDGRVAGVTSYVMETSLFGGEPEFEVGEEGYSTRVSAFADYIDVIIGGWHHLVLDMNNQPEGGDGIADSIEARLNGQNLELVVNGTVVHSDALSEIASLTVNGSADRDILTIAAELGLNVHADGRGGNNDLTVLGTNQADTMTVQLRAVTMANRTIDYSNMQSLTVNTAGGADVLNIERTEADTPVTIRAGTGRDTIQVGSEANRASIWGALAVHGQDGSDTLNINEQDHPFGSEYTITASTVTRSPWATITYDTVETVVLNASGGNDTFHVQSTDGEAEMTINAGNGRDIVEVGSIETAAVILGRLVVNGQDDGGDILRLYDQNSGLGLAYTISNSTVTRSLSAAIEYHTVEHIRLYAGSANDSIAVNSLPGNTDLDIYAGRGSDTLVGASGGAVNLWNITQRNGGRFGNSVTFSSVENLHGAATQDEFIFADGNTVSGTVDGLGGTDTLNYSDYTSAVVVDLQSGSATGTGGVRNVENVTGGRGNDLLRGNDRSNVLVGNAGHDILIGRGGNDSLNGSAGRNLLIGGGGADTLNGGGSEDIAISGTTSYDANDQALRDILAEWSRNDQTYSQRRDHLGNGGGLNGNTRLNRATVSGDQSADELRGGLGLDWFFVDRADTILDLSDREQVVQMWDFVPPGQIAVPGPELPRR